MAIVPVPGTAYTLRAQDNGAVILFQNGSASTLTVPPGLNAEFQCVAIQQGAGQVAISAASGVTIHNRQSQTHTNAQWAMVSLVAYGANAFVLGGDTG